MDKPHIGVYTVEPASTDTRTHTDTHAHTHVHTETHSQTHIHAMIHTERDTCAYTYTDIPQAYI